MLAVAAEVVPPLTGLLCRWLPWVAALAVAIRADASPPRVTLVLVEGLSPTALHSPLCPTLASLARRGAVGLMAMPVRATISEASAVLSLSCGVPVRALGSDDEIYLANEQVEGTTARNVLLRRAGTLVPAATPAAVHLGVADLARRGLLGKLLGARLASAGAVLRPAVRFVPESGYMARLAALLVTDSRGVASLADGSAPLVILHADGSLAVLERVLRPQVADRRRTVWIVGLPEHSEGNGFAVPPALTVLGGAGIQRGLLTSATTRTPGLIAFSDVSASLVSWYTAGTPTTGKVVTILVHSSALQRVERLDRLTRSNTRAMVPVLLICGLAVALAIAAGVAALGGLRHYGKPSLAILKASMGLPAAFLVVGPVVAALPRPVEWPAYLGLVALASIACSLVFAAMGRALPTEIGLRRFAVSCLGLTSAAAVLDGLAGQPGIKSSLLAACGLSGIRFYGVGNEYMAVLVGSLLGLLFLCPTRPWHSMAVGVGLAVFFGLGVVGANAGGVVTAVCAFVSAASLQRLGRLPHPRVLIALPLMGVAVAFVFAGIDAQAFGQSSSHLGGALQAARDAGPEELLDIAGRKFLMNLGILISQPALLSVAAIGVLATLAGAALRRYAERIAAFFPGWLRWRDAAVYAAAVAFVFNDTGVVAALFVLGIWAFTGLYLLMESEFGSGHPAQHPRGLVE